MLLLILQMKYVERIAVSLHVLAGFKLKLSKTILDASVFLDDAFSSMKSTSYILATSDDSDGSFLSIKTP